MDTLYDFFTASKSVYQVTEKHTIAAILWQLEHQLGRIDLVANEFHVVDEPTKQLNFGLFINWLNLYIISLDIKCLHLLHNLIYIVNWSTLRLASWTFHTRRRTSIAAN